MIKIVLIICGCLSLTAGIAGIFIPLLPTTPFLLLSATCFMRSSPRLYKWMLRHPIFGSYIRNYREYHAITVTAKIVSLSLLWICIGYSAFFVAHHLWITAVLLLIAVSVTVHILRLRTLTTTVIKVVKPGTRT